MGGRTLWLLVLLTVGCSAQGDSTRRSSGISDADGDEDAVSGEAGGSDDGAMQGAGQDFGNSAADPGDGAAGSTAAPADTGAGAARPDCSPGLYLGKYQCTVDFLGVLPLPLEGDVSFNLEINEELMEGNCLPSDEFCPDLVIAEGSGTLFGLAGLIGFEAPLAGGLDCATGEFRTAMVDGIYGSPVSSDPSDPDALWTVGQPPLGTFLGSLQGTHNQGDPEAIDGEWMLTDQITGSSCTGAFGVELRP